MAILRETVASLARSIGHAREHGRLGAVAVDLIDNGTDDTRSLDELVTAELAGIPVTTLQVHRGHGNVGYGVGHNLSVARFDTAFHLVLNPDVVMAEDALSQAVRFMDDNEKIGLLTPSVRGFGGEHQYLCRRYPSVLTLLLRGFAPAGVKRLFTRRLDYYEMRDIRVDEPRLDVLIATGCFMFARTSALQAVSGFAPEFFLYFEDYDLSLRLNRVTNIAYVPSVEILHAGGGVAKKGLLHVRLYIRSAARFYRRHGLRIV